MMTAAERAYWDRAQARAVRARPEIREAIVRAFRDLRDKLDTRRLAEIIETQRIEPFLDAIERSATRRERLQHAVRDEALMFGFEIGEVVRRVAYSVVPTLRTATGTGYTGAVATELPKALPKVPTTAKEVAQVWTSALTSESPRWKALLKDTKPKVQEGIGRVMFRDTLTPNAPRPWESAATRAAAAGPERIMAAAVKEAKTGIVSVGLEDEIHAQIADRVGMQQYAEIGTQNVPAGEEEYYAGFVTNRGRFVERRDAYGVAGEANQIIGEYNDYQAVKAQLGHVPRIQLGTEDVDFPRLTAKERAALERKANADLTGPARVAYDLQRREGGAAFRDTLSTDAPSVAPTFAPPIPKPEPANVVVAANIGNVYAGPIDGNLTIKFDYYRPGVREAIAQLDTKVMQIFTDDLRETIRQTVAQGLEAGKSTDAIARVIREQVGLAPNQQLAIANYERMLRESSAVALQRKLRDRRFDPRLKAAIAGKPLTEAQIQTMTAAYRRRMVAFNANTIATTAANDAQRLGEQIAWKDAVAKGYVDPARLVKKWVGVMDERERPTHVAMEGEEKPYDEPFSNGQMVPGEDEFNCRCRAPVHATSQASRDVLSAEARAQATLVAEHEFETNERAIGIDETDGSVIVDMGGQHGSVSYPSDDVLNRIANGAPNTIAFLHNHPPESPTTFSLTDASWLAVPSVRELRVATGPGVFTLTKTNKWNTNPTWRVPTLDMESGRTVLKNELWARMYKQMEQDGLDASEPVTQETWYTPKFQKTLVRMYEKFADDHGLRFTLNAVAPNIPTPTVVPLRDPAQLSFSPAFNEMIEAAAAKRGRQVWTSKYHYGAMVQGRRATGGEADDFKYGFTTVSGRFVTPEAALRLAERAGQINDKGRRYIAMARARGEKPRLLSEWLTAPDVFAGTFTWDK